MQSLTKRLSSSQDIADAIMQRQAMANENNQDKNSHVQVYVAVLDVNEAKAIQDEHLNTNFVHIANLESLYNYRTVGEEFKIVSSVLSMNESYVDVQMKSDEQNDEIVNFQKETTIPDSVSLVQYNTIRSKMTRIKTAFSKSKAFENRTCTIDFSNLFSSNHSQQISQEEIETSSQDEYDKDNGVESTNAEISKPIYCRDDSDKTLKKPSCKSCNSQCNLEVNDLKTELNFISRATIEEELANHAHPKSRKIAGVWRTTAQAKIELLEHYCHSHHKE
jgi:hypothetical protein